MSTEKALELLPKSTRQTFYVIITIGAIAGGVLMAYFAIDKWVVGIAEAQVQEHMQPMALCLESIKTDLKYVKRDVRDIKGRVLGTNASMPDDEPAPKDK